MRASRARLQAGVELVAGVGADDLAHLAEPLDEGVHAADRIAGRFSAQTSSQMSGWPLATRVMSRKPPAARRSRAACSSARSAATPIRLAAVRCGTWLTTATISSWCCGRHRHDLGAELADDDGDGGERGVVGAGHRREDPGGAAEHGAVGAVEPVELAAGHRVAADEAGVVDGLGDRALDAADVGDDAAGLGERPLDLIGDGEHGDGHERDAGGGVEPGGVDASPGRRRRRAAPARCRRR